MVSSSKMALGPHGTLDTGLAEVKLQQFHHQG